jgi:hypothetical protein
VAIACAGALLALGGGMEDSIANVGGGTTTPSPSSTAPSAPLGTQAGVAGAMDEAAALARSAERARAAEAAHAAANAPHRLHVFVSNDWDVPDHAPETFRLQEELHAKHPDLRVTQFVGPYTFTDPLVSAQTAQRNVDWLRRMEAEHGGEIGLHIHPYTHFVEASGLRARTGPGFYSPRPGRDVGHSVNLAAAFNEAETAQLLQGAKRIFAEAGLPEPRAFRAGGWTAGEHTLRALADEGFRVDASAVAYELLDSWKDNGQPLYGWLAQHWPGMNTHSQPYFPARYRSGLRAALQKKLPLLEIPDNAALADYATAERMIEIFHQTVADGLEDGPRVLSIGYHGVSLPSYVDHIDGALTYLDQFLAKDGAGPVVYSTAQEIADLFGAAK